MVAGVDPRLCEIDTPARMDPQAPRGATVPSPPPRVPRSFLALPLWEGLLFGDYSAALATRAASASSKASIRRAVCCGDFVKRASRL
ncbi:MAG: hypothetical protein JWP86_2923 [Phenylobacterium sp.]|nr:hypothetical protein [Phenylobacterium sp.]MDB5495586.1 hypothetical protein [Phenylobacterium sp.]